MPLQLHNFLFGIYPYIALAVLAVGSIIRYDRDPYTWRAGSSQLLRRRQLIVGSVLFHVGVLIIFFGHLIGLLTPVAVFHALGLSNTFKQVMAMTVGGIAGGMALIGATLLLHRRLYDPRIRRASSFSDNMILILLYIQLLLGVSTIFVSAQHLDGEEMLRLMAWAQGIFTFDLNAPSYIVDVSPVFKLHLFLGLTIFLLFPFTRLVHMLSAPVRYLWRGGYQIVRTRKPAARG